MSSHINFILSNCNLYRTVHMPKYATTRNNRYLISEFFFVFLPCNFLLNHLKYYTVNYEVNTILSSSTLVK